MNINVFGTKRDYWGTWFLSFDFKSSFLHRFAPQFNRFLFSFFIVSNYALISITMFMLPIWTTKCWFFFLLREIKRTEKCLYGSEFIIIEWLKRIFCNIELMNKLTVEKYLKIFLKIFFENNGQNLFALVLTYSLTHPLLVLPIHRTFLKVILKIYVA